jgi:C-terminal processing protease CtpA/Prc
MQTVNSRVVLSIGVVLGLLFGPGVGRGQRGGPPDFPIDAQMRIDVIDGALAKLHEAYVFPDVARQMEEAVKARLAKGEYDQITTAKQLCDALTEHFREVSKDRHLGLMYSKNEIPRPTQPQEVSAEDRERRRKEGRERQRTAGALSNFGFEKVERLPGNIGYLDFRMFADPDLAGETAAAAMTFLANTDALLVDMRQNGGGSPAMVAVMCSWFFDGGAPVHVNDIYSRRDDSTKQFWTLPYLPGKRYLDKDVYILTSQRTFSGAEEFTYNLKNLKRATVVGETTGGGAHPTAAHFINSHFGIRVPFARAINPITKTNWEGTGVTPDIACPADQALKSAHLLALQKKLDKSTDPGQVAALKRFIETTEKELAELKKQP